MKSSLSVLAGFVGAAGLMVGMSSAALAQTNPTPGTNPNPSIFNDPLYNNQQPGRQPQSVVVPSSSESKSIESIVSESPSFTIFNSLLRVVDQRGGNFSAMLGGDRDYTVYAPTDAAFAALPEGAIRTLVQPENNALLERILAYHIVRGEVAYPGANNTGISSQPSQGRESIPGEQNLTTQQSDRATATVVLDQNAQPVRGQNSASTSSTNNAPQPGPESIPGQQNLPTQQSDRATASVVLNQEAERSPVIQSDRAGGAIVNNARIIGTNIRANNGVIYPIDRLIFPPSLQNELGFAPQTGTSNRAF